MTSLAVLQEHYEEPYHRGECENATHASESVCEETGCHLRFELCLPEADNLPDSDTLQEVWWDGQGCVYCEGFASFLAGEMEATQWDKAVAAKQLGELLEELQGNLTEARPCLGWVPQLLLAAVENADQEDDWSEAGEFGGPSLGEEC